MRIVKEAKPKEIVDSLIDENNKYFRQPEGMQWQDIDHKSKRKQIPTVEFSV